VQRAWNRGLEVGRYKAVDDTLAHAVEAYTGMPQLFFTWIASREKRVHFEFLDNEVPAGQRPLTAAYGWNDEITILDERPLRDVERFRRIDVNAKSPATLFPHQDPSAAPRDAAFLQECLKRFRRVRYANRQTLRVNYPLANKKQPAGETNPATQQIDFYIRSPQMTPKNKPTRQVFAHFFGMEVTWK
jgi:hypothetical protein